ncbi:MAG: carboxypeptidase regulatory-like domain-containing protein [Thermoanaerobaculia bacterium]|nr:carboxypeptidase regulatory-like domain-containing protein [Thermoanaerobaculia bacterium]
MRISQKSLLAVVTVASVLLAGALSAEMLPEKRSGRAEVMYPVKVDVSPALRSIPIPPAKPVENREVPNKTTSMRKEVLGTSERIQTTPGVPNTPDPLAGWPGLGSDENQTIIGGRLMPPDTQGDIGKDHYVQWNNLVFAIWDKSGNKVFPAQPGPVAAPGDLLWDGFGGPCETYNDGDPITLWDPLAERWVMSQFAVSMPSAPFYQCVAVSTTSDPTGQWYRYAYAWPGNRFPDYPKLGVWTDGYYITTNDFNSSLTSFVGITAGAFERDKMLDGLPAGFVYFQMTDGGARDYSALPADLDGNMAPPAGSPGLIGEFQDKTWFTPNLPTDQIWLYKLTLDWANPANSTFGIGATHEPDFQLAISDVSENCGGRDCVPQGSSAQKVDDIDFRIMHRLAYRNLGSAEALVASMTVGAGGRAGVWWGEFQNNGAGWATRQDGVYAPADSMHRWMPSIAMDTNGNIMLGYSASSTTIYPSVRYTGRLAGDPLGQMGDEKEMVVGAGAQSGGNRWGDYSMMTIDPVDGCTFWYTQEYIAASGNFDWDTWIGNMKFSTCSAGPAGILEGYVKSTAGGDPIAGASVQIGASYSTTTNASGFYQITVPVGTYDVTASKFGFDTATALAQEVLEDATTTVADLLLTPVGTYAVDGFVTAAEHNWPLWARIEVRQAGNLVQTVYNSPWNGYYEIPELPNGFTYEFTVHSMYTGYLDEVRPVTIAAGDQIQSFSLTPASGNPAYTCYLVGGVNEDFNAGFPPLGWTVKNNGSVANNIWKLNTVWGRANETGGTGTAAAADSDKAGSGSGPFDTELWSPPILMPADPRNLKFKQSYRQFTGETGTVDVSTNGGNTWTNLLTITTTSTAEQTVDMTAYAGQLIILRWKFVSPSWSYYWQVDDVRTETIPPPPPPPTSVWTQDWDGVTAPALPAGWATATVTGSPTWLLVTSLTNPTIATGHTTPNFFRFNSYSVSSGTARIMKTTDDDLSAGAGYLRFWMYHDTAYTSADRVNAQVSTDGGTTWQTVGSAVNRYDGSTGWKQHEIALTGFTGSAAAVRVGLLATSAYGSNVAVDGFELLVGAAVPPAVVDSPNLVCESVAGTLVAGFVTDANSGAGVVGADVVRDLGGLAKTVAATGNLPDGFYYMFSPAPATNGPSTRTFTASKTGFGTVAHSVNLVPDTVNRLDFALPAAALSLSNWPFVIDGRLTPDGEPAWDKTDMFSVLNSGGLPAEVTLSVSALPQTFPHMFPAFVPSAPTAKTKPFMGRAQKAGKPSNAKKYPGLAGSLAGVPAYGVDLYPGGNFVSWADASVPGAWNVVAPAASYFGGDFINGDFSTLYVLDYDTNQLASIDTATGAATVIGAATPNAGQNWTGLAGAPGGVLYASSTDCGGASTLYTIDTATGHPTVVGPITNTDCLIALAANGDGELFAVDLGSDSLLSIDPATGAGTVVGPLGFDANYAQGMDFDEESGTLYWAAYGSSGELRAIDTATGASYLIGAFPGGAEVDSFAIAAGGGGGTVPWLTLTPMEGVVPAAGQLDINAEFFPEGVNPAHYGLFRGVIQSTNDTPNDLPDIPVYFTKSFLDVPRGHWADAFIHALAGMRVTRGCGGGNFCPDANITRAQMAVTMVRAMYGPDYAPPPAIGVFADVEISDTDTTADYIEQLYNDGIVAGCASGPPMLYCPSDFVNRAQMSVFLSAGLGIPAVVPPTGFFVDVTGTPYAWAAPFAEGLYEAGITAGCGPNLFCPADLITRAQLSVWLVTSIGLPYYIHPVTP